MPDVTVVVPTRNRAGLLGPTLRSVTAQEGVDVDVVVVDDGSTDITAELVSGLDDPRVRVLRHERPLGVSISRNHGVAEAAGDWIAFLDDDDLWAPDKLAAQLTAMRRADRTWAVTGAVSIDDDLQVLAGERPLEPARMVAELDRYNSVPAGASNVVVRRDVLAEAGGFDERLRHMADWDLWLRLGRLGEPATVDRPLVAYRLHRANATIDTAFDAREPLEEFELIVRRHGIVADRPAVYRWIGWSSLRAGRRGAAVRAYARAVRWGDLRSIARLLNAFVHPAVGKRIFYRPFPGGLDDDPYATQARAWLRPLARPTA